MIDLTVNPRRPNLQDNHHNINEFCNTQLNPSEEQDVERLPDIGIDGGTCLCHLIFLVFNSFNCTDEIGDLHNPDSTQCKRPHQDDQERETISGACMLQTSTVRSSKRARTTRKDCEKPESQQQHNALAENPHEVGVESSQLGKGKQKTFILSRSIGRNLPAAYIPFVKSITKVKGDGHSAFRSISVSIGKSEDDWATIQEQLISEIQSRPDFYTDNQFKKLTGLRGVDECATALKTGRQKPLSPSEQVCRLHMTAMTTIIANTFKRPVIYLANGDAIAQTTFPYFVGPNENAPIVIALIKPCSFISVSFDFKNDHLVLPNICPSWERFQKDSGQEVVQWAHKYQCHHNPEPRAQSSKRPKRHR